MVARHPDPRLFGALGDATRLSLVERLAAEGPLSTTELAADTAMSRQAVHKHLDVLAGVGLVHDVRQGRRRVWRLDARPMADIAAWAAAFEARWSASFDRLQDLLDEEEG